MPRRYIKIGWQIHQDHLQCRDQIQFACSLGGRHWRLIHRENSSRKYRRHLGGMQHECCWQTQELSMGWVNPRVALGWVGHFFYFLFWWIGLDFGVRRWRTEMHWIHQSYHNREDCLSEKTNRTKLFAGVMCWLHLALVRPSMPSSWFTVMSWWQHVLKVLSCDTIVSFCYGIGRVVD